MAATIDVEVINQGSVIGFLPKSQQAAEWCDENITEAQRFGLAYWVAHICAADIINSMQADGLEVF